MRLDYTSLQARVTGMPPVFFSMFVAKELPERLSDMWCRAYRLDCLDSEIVAVDLDTFTYLFDIKQQRNIAAYGVMGGHNRAARDRDRMKNYPKSEGTDYHRGHMIPHSGHGGTDINLFIQKGSVNIGPFRQLERLAVAHSGSFYFVRVAYPPGSSTQRPSLVEQGLFLNTTPVKVEIRSFGN